MFFASPLRLCICALILLCCRTPAAASARCDDPRLVSDTFSLKKMPVTNRVKPAIPAAVLQQKIVGCIEVLFVVRTDGSVDEAAVSESSLPDVLNNAALVAVRQWRYEPFVRDGKPVAQRVMVMFHFGKQGTPSWSSSRDRAMWYGG